MHNHIENIRKQAKKRGIKPTTAIIKSAIALHCPNNQDIAQKLPEIVAEVVRLCSKELATCDDNAMVHQSEPLTNVPSNDGDIDDVQTQAIVQLVKELGDRFTEDDVLEIKQLACLLSTDVKDTESLVNSLITAYLQKRNSVLKGALTQLERGRKAQNEEMYGGVDSDFFCERDREWQRFGKELLGLFN
ncbi:MAG: hypothetical protein HC836_10350 [Richelia sp. RM2_1_2]|nr:hypothetical protein [Richelia sp. SM2_1_7]NJM17371.1 hypothetical protein [Richelia sp. SM1_7_0]NJN13266.1 hypothetical protein [Richelia sp. RM1_1_1]NJO26881.1 hypothetical protein [Richelia sp. SL_2_1]NJO58724.1 hypothetical protein [Richelia sp. RM2_1_2]